MEFIQKCRRFPSRRGIRQVCSPGKLLFTRKKPSRVDSRVDPESIPSRFRVPRRRGESVEEDLVQQLREYHGLRGGCHRSQGIRDPIMRPPRAESRGIREPRVFCCFFVVARGGATSRGFFWVLFCRLWPGGGRAKWWCSFWDSFNTTKKWPSKKRREEPPEVGIQSLDLMLWGSFWLHSELLGPFS